MFTYWTVSSDLKKKKEKKKKGIGRTQRYWGLYIILIIHDYPSLHTCSLCSLRRSAILERLLTSRLKVPSPPSSGPASTDTTHELWLRWVCYTYITLRYIHYVIYTISPQVCAWCEPLRSPQRAITTISIHSQAVPRQYLWVKVKDAAPLATCRSTGSPSLLNWMNEWDHANKTRGSLSLLPSFNLVGRPPAHHSFSVFWFFFGFSLIFYVFFPSIYSAIVINVNADCVTRNTLMQYFHTYLAECVKCELRNF